MGDRRKLNAEIEKTIKKVLEGRAQFQETLAKFEQAQTQTQKEKFETDLKKDIKKLQRLRDQLKSWCTSNEIKDKSNLLNARKEIESDMERFKSIEKETKTKAYSKEGLGLETKKDPLQKEKEECEDWFKSVINRLSLAVESVEFNIETCKTQNKIKKKKVEKEKTLELQKLRLDYLQRHIFWCETCLRALDNDNLDLDMFRLHKTDIEDYACDLDEVVDFDFSKYEDVICDTTKLETDTTTLSLSRCLGPSDDDSNPGPDSEVRVFDTGVLCDPGGATGRDSSVVGHGSELRAGGSKDLDTCSSSISSNVSSIVSNSQSPSIGPGNNNGGGSESGSNPASAGARSSVGKMCLESESTTVTGAPPSNPGVSALSSGPPAATMMMMTTMMASSPNIKTFTDAAAAGSLVSSSVGKQQQQQQQQQSSTAASSAASRVKESTAAAAAAVTADVDTTAAASSLPISTSTLVVSSAQSLAINVSICTNLTVGDALSAHQHTSTLSAAGSAGVTSASVTPAISSSSSLCAVSTSAAYQVAVQPLIARPNDLSGCRASTTFSGPTFALQTSSSVGLTPGSGGFSSSGDPSDTKMSSLRSGGVDPAVSALLNGMASRPNAGMKNGLDFVGHPGSGSGNNPAAGLPSNSWETVGGDVRRMHSFPADAVYSSSSVPSSSSSIITSSNLGVTNTSALLNHQSSRLMAANGIPAASGMLFRHNMGSLNSGYPGSSSGFNPAGPSRQLLGLDPFLSQQQQQQQQQQSGHGGLTGRLGTGPVYPGSGGTADMFHSQHMSTAAGLRSLHSAGMSTGGNGKHGLSNLNHNGNYLMMESEESMFRSRSAAVAGLQDLSQCGGPGGGGGGGPDPLLEMFYRRSAKPEDSNRARMTLLKLPPAYETRYPKQPLEVSHSEEYYSKLDVSTLFFIFYYFEGTRAQYLASKALKRKSWRFHKQHLLWFQRLEEPKSIDEEFESGAYVFWDVETKTQKKKDNFKFEYRYLEDPEM